MSPDRYTVGLVSGFRYMVLTRYPPKDTGSSNRRPIDTWYVHDSCFCFKQVAYFDNLRFFERGKPMRIIPAELLARSKARKLNKQHRKWLRARGLS